MLINNVHLNHANLFFCKMIDRKSLIVLIQMKLVKEKIVLSFIPLSSKVFQEIQQIIIILSYSKSKCNMKKCHYTWINYLENFIKMAIFSKSGETYDKSM